VFAQANIPIRMPFDLAVTAGRSPAGTQQEKGDPMTVSKFEGIRNSLLPAQDRCIAQLNELVFQPQPSSDDILQGVRLIDEFKQIHFDALARFIADPDSFPVDTMADMLSRSQTILTESLLSLDEVMLRSRSRT
jgi:hypothetical protein